jgi:DNA-directed RNA polymerase II subunit RPB1
MYKQKKLEASKIVGIQFSILSPDEIRNSSVAHITNRDTYINNKPVIGGLFDPRMGILDPGLTCPTDGLNYMETPGYFGHLEIARPVFYIQYLSTVLKILRCICIKCSKILLNKTNYEHLLDLNAKKRWDAIFHISNKIKRCGEENEDGCGCKKPNKVFKEGLATIFAEWDNTEGIADENGDIQPKFTMKLTPELVIKLFRRISDEDITFMGFSPTWSRPDWMVCQVLAIPPPAVRPSIKHDAQQRSEDDISHIIVNIIKANKTLQEKIQQNAHSKVIADWHTVLQYYIATMIDNKIPGVAPTAQRSGRALKSIKERLVGKQGRVRGNLMGKRVDFSARSVITPDPNLSIRELGVPIKIAKNITKPIKVTQRNKAYLTKLVRNGPEVHPGAKVLERHTGESISLRVADRNSIVLSDGDIVHRHLDDGDIVLFNRQPTLHKMSMMGHITKVMRSGDTFRMNVADTKPYNADFDGDEMNMHGPQDVESDSELLNLGAVARLIISPANNQSIIGIFQDSLLGCYLFTKENVAFTKRMAMNLLMNFNNVNVDLFNKKDDKVSNFEILSQILPPMSLTGLNKSFKEGEDKKNSNNVVEIKNGQYIRGQMDKGVLGGKSKGLIQRIYNDFGFSSSADFIDNLQSIITDYMKSSSYSVGISDLIADNITNENITKSITERKKEVQNLIDQVQIGVFENNTGKSNEEEFETRVNAILNNARQDASKIGRKSLSTDNRFVIMTTAGSKGNDINISQMISCLGQQNVDGKRIPYGFDNRTLPHYCQFDDSPEARGFVENSFIQGLTPQQLYFHAMGGRVGLIDTAVKTSTTGYIQRRLVKGMEDCKVNYDMTVRNSKNKIIQFAYGDDGMESSKVETQTLPIVRMELEEIYAHFHPPTEDENIIFTKRALKRAKKVMDKTKQTVDYIIKMRNGIAQYVFKYNDDIKVNTPVNFRYVINNIQNQLYIQSNSLVDVTFTELYEMLDQTYEHLSSMKYVRPTELFHVMYIYYLSPRELLIKRRFNKKALILLFKTIIFMYKRAIVHPGEMVGVIAAQSIGEPTTQMTLNTFHFAGVASKSNVTRGVPRIEEILSLSEHPKNPSLTVYLKQKDETSRQHARELMHTLEHTNLRDVTLSVSICFDPDDMNTLLDMDRSLMEEYNEFQKLMEDCIYGEDDETKSKWVIRFEFDKEAMLDKNISMDDIHYAIKNSYKDDVYCIYSDLNSDNLVFRVRLNNSLMQSKKKSVDQSDQIYMLKNIQDNLLDNIILRGIKNIPKVILRKLPGNIIKEGGNYVNKESWVLDTVGTNLLEVLSIDAIDGNRTFSNDIMEIHRVLGIEACRQSILNELSDVIEFDGTYINVHHLALLCDRMTATKKLVSMFRHGINNDDIGPLAKASFEETPEMFLRAARHAELDLMRGVSANVMCGQRGYFGTNCFQIFLDMNKMQHLEEKFEKEEEPIKFETGTQACSIENIQIPTNLEYISKKDTGKVDDSYDLDF